MKNRSRYMWWVKTKYIQKEDSSRPAEANPSTTWRRSWFRIKTWWWLQDLGCQKTTLVDLADSNLKDNKNRNPAKGKAMPFFSTGSIGQDKKLRSGCFFFLFGSRCSANGVVPCSPDSFKLVPQMSPRRFHPTHKQPPNHKRAGCPHSSTLIM